MNPILELARRINEREALIQEINLKTLDNGNRGFTEMLLQGQDLLKLKAGVRHGEWSGFLSQHCPRVSDRQARRYMQTAKNRKRVSGLGKAASLRAAIAMIEKKNKRPSKEPKRWPPYLEALGRLNKLAQYIKAHPISQWPSNDVEQFRDALMPIAEALWPGLPAWASRVLPEGLAERVTPAAV